MTITIMDRGVVNGVHEATGTKLFNDDNDVIVSDIVFEKLVGVPAGSLGFSIARQKFFIPESARVPEPKPLTREDVEAAASAGAVAAVYKTGKGVLHNYEANMQHISRVLYRGGGWTSVGLPHTNENQIVSSITQSVNMSILSFLLEDRTDLIAYGSAVLTEGATVEQRAAWCKLAIDTCVTQINMVNGFKLGTQLEFLSPPKAEDSCRNHELGLDRFDYHVNVKLNLALTRRVQKVG